MQVLFFDCLLGLQKLLLNDFVGSHLLLILCLERLDPLRHVGYLGLLLDLEGP